MANITFTKANVIRTEKGRFGVNDLSTSSSFSTTLVRGNMGLADQQGRIDLELYDNASALVQSAVWNPGSSASAVSLRLTDGVAGDDGSSASAVHWFTDVASFSTGKVIMRLSGTTMQVPALAFILDGNGFNVQFRWSFSGGGQITFEFPFTVA